MIRTLKLLLVCIISVSSVFFSTSSVYAKSATINNDGTAMDNPYGDSGLDKSFSDLEYYDCFVPYNLTPEDIGGYSVGAVWYKYAQYNAPMSTQARSQKVTSYVNWENDIMNPATGFSTLRNLFSSVSHYYEADTGMSILTDKNGTNYYVTAVPGFFFYNSSAGTNGFSSYSSSAWGTLIDVILTDGTVIHFVMGDSVAPQHSNGGIPNPAYFDVIYKNSELKLSQYKHLFHAQSGHAIEVWGKSGCSQKFMEKYNIGSGDGNNKIALYRVYNAKIFDNPSRSSGVGGDVSYSYGNVTIGSNGGKSDTDSTGSKIVSEYDLVGMSRDTFLDGFNDIRLPTYDDLGSGEQYSLVTIKNNILENRSISIYDKVRVFTVFVGLAVIVYSVLLLFALVFDSVNNIVDIELLAILTLGRLRYSEEGFKMRKSGFVDKKTLIKLSLITMSVGFLVVSGSVYNWVLDIYYNISNIMG